MLRDERKKRTAYCCGFVALSQNPSIAVQKERRNISDTPLTFTLSLSKREMESRKRKRQLESLVVKSAPTSLLPHGGGCLKDRKGIDSGSHTKAILLTKEAHYD